ncbi:MAG: hypothetical protein MI919_13765 [Holophagales bacterium]|nr:hypothetical protein [Holophagales bacterium]
MGPDATFRTHFPTFASFLEKEGAGDGHVPDNSRFPARNFLLDENVPVSRSHGYEEYGVARGFTTRGEWAGAHWRYLRNAVYLDRPMNGAPGTLDPKNRKRCPETFRLDDNLTSYGKAHSDLHLLRVIDAKRLCDRAGRPLSAVVDGALDVARARAEETEPDPAKALLFESALGQWNRQCDLRPCFATFYAEHEDLFENSAELEGWANELRNRLGLAHIDPGARGERVIFVFRYSVDEVPKRKGFRGKPLAVPSVLDIDLSEAFCPAPKDVGHGHTVHLAGTAPRPCREVLHPYMDFEAKHLFQVGRVTAAVPADLEPARRAHLEALRSLAGRPDYGTHTEGEG